MKRVHSRVLAIVTSILLIQAADPPFENSSPFISQNSEKPIESSAEENLNAHATPSSGDERFPSLTTTEPFNYEAINHFLSRQGKTNYEKLLEKDLVRPLLKLYETEPFKRNYTQPKKRISKEDRIEELATLSKDDLDQLLHNHHIYQQPIEIFPNDQQSARRSGGSFHAHNDKEHIGEILPPNYKENVEETPYAHLRSLYDAHQRSPKVFRKSYDYNEGGFSLEDYEYHDSPARFRRPVAYQEEVRFRPSEYDISSSENYDAPAYSGEESRFVPLYKRPEDDANFMRIRPGFVYPRRQRGYRDALVDGGAGAQWTNSWASARRPRVIFPSDGVAFRDHSQEEQDWLAPDVNLQDLQQQDTRDRGSHGFFFVLIWDNHL